MSRYEVMSLKQAVEAGYNNAGREFDLYADEVDEYDDRQALVDTKWSMVIWVDGMEPEDAILGRSLYPFVNELNRLAQESPDE